VQSPDITARFFSGGLYLGGQMKLLVKDMTIYLYIAGRKVSNKELEE
jgi:hypothetical protein